jgi:transposase
MEEMSMSGKRSTDALKIEAIKQVTERGFTVGEVAQRLGSATSSLYAWEASSQVRMSRSGSCQTTTRRFVGCKPRSSA